MQPKMKVGKGAAIRLLLIDRDSNAVAIDWSSEENVSRILPGLYGDLVEKRSKRHRR